MSVSETSPPLVVAVDGPGGSGKSTVARGVARRLGLSYLDTGAMYRAVAWRVLREGRNPWDRQAAAAAAAEVCIELETDPGSPVVTVDGVDVSRSIRGEAVTAAVSPVSAVPEVRERMVARQREIIAASADSGGIVVEGRDIGTVVAPDATVKVFLTASSAGAGATTRRADWASGPAWRRDADIARAEQALATRDRLDSTREASPLVQAPDALVIDSTELGVDEVVDLVVQRCRQALAGGQRAEPIDASRLPPRRRACRPVLADPPRWRPRLNETLKKPARPLINHVLLRVRVHGLEHVPRNGGLIVAGGHAGWLDGPLVVIESRRPVRCLTKSELYASPARGEAARFRRADSPRARDAGPQRFAHLPGRTRRRGGRGRVPGRNPRHRRAGFRARRDRLSGCAFGLPACPRRLHRNRAGLAQARPLAAPLAAGRRRLRRAVPRAGAGPALVAARVGRSGRNDPAPAA